MWRGRVVIWCKWMWVISANILYRLLNHPGTVYTLYTRGLLTLSESRLWNHFCFIMTKETNIEPDPPSDRVWFLGAVPSLQLAYVQQKTCKGRLPHARGGTMIFWGLLLLFESCSLKHLIPSLQKASSNHRRIALLLLVFRFTDNSRGTTLYIR
jgi:hypothetical protein